MSTSKIDAKTIVQVENLLAQYVQAIDARDGAALGRLCTDDAVQTGHPKGPFRDRHAIVTFYSQLAQTDPPRRHHINSINVHRDETDALRATAYFIVVGGPRVAGVYDFEIVLDDEGVSRIACLTSRHELRDG